MAHSRRHPDRLLRILERLCVLHEMTPGPADHMPVGNLDAAISMILAQHDAGAELLASAAHLAAQIIGIAEATQSQRLALAQTHFAGKTKRLLVFRQAAIDIT